MVLLLAPLSLLPKIVRETYRGCVSAWWKSHREGIAPFLFIVFPAYAFTVAHAAGWGVCGAPALFISALAFASTVLSGVMFGIYWDAYDLPGKALFQNASMLALAATIAITAFVHYALQVADGWESLYIEGARQLLVTLSMVAMVGTVGIFIVKYGKSREQNWRWRWCVLVLFVILIGLGVVFYYSPLDADDCRIEHGVDIQLYVAQTLWAGVTVLAAILGAIFAAHVPKLPLWLLLLLTVTLAYLAGQYSAIQDEHGTLQPSGFVLVLLGIWYVYMTLDVAMLGATMASRMKVERT